MRRGGAPVVPPEAASESVAQFEAFVRGAEPPLRRALVAAYGFEDGRDATAEAFAYAWGVPLSTSRYHEQRCSCCHLARGSGTPDGR